MNQNLSPETVGSGVIAGSVLWLFLKRIFRRGADETTATASANAQTEVIELLRQEVRRMADANKDLAARFAESQQEIMRLRGEILDLNGDINRLKDEVRNLSNRG